MKEQFVTYEIALALKELGFDEECIGFFKSSYIWDFVKDIKINHGVVLHVPEFDDEIQTFLFPEYNKEHCEYLRAPLWQQAIDWFRAKGLSITFKYYIPESYSYVIFPTKKGLSITNGFYSEFIYDDYYEAREQAILKAIELCKEKH